MAILYLCYENKLKKGLVDALAKGGKKQVKYV